MFTCKLTKNFLLTGSRYGVSPAVDTAFDSLSDTAGMIRSKPGLNLEALKSAAATMALPGLKLLS